MGPVQGLGSTLDFGSSFREYIGFGVDAGFRVYSGFGVIVLQAFASCQVLLVLHICVYVYSIYIYTYIYNTHTSYTYVRDFEQSTTTREPSWALSTMHSHASPLIA